MILITDGLETCNADPCALGRQLETDGVDFTAHVVGFGLSAEEGRQVACLAEETGGKYFQADNAEALSEALTETVAEVVEPPPPVEEPAEVAELPEASLDAPESIEIGRPLVVGWDGPGERYDTIVIFDPQGQQRRRPRGPGAAGQQRRHGCEDRALTAPVTPGDYELQYQYGRRHDVIATRPITVVEAEVSLSAPADAAIGTTITVGWVGPGARYDAIEIFDPGAKQGEGDVVRSSARQQWRSRQQDGAARRPDRAGFLPVALLERRRQEGSRHPPDRGAGGRGEHRGAGHRRHGLDRRRSAGSAPARRYDAIELYDPQARQGEGEVLRSARLSGGDFDGRTVKLVMPTDAGTYQLRYWNGRRQVSPRHPRYRGDRNRGFVVGAGVGGNGPHLQGRPGSDPAAAMTPSRCTIRRATTATARSSCPNVCPAATSTARTVELVAPNEPGDYQLRYWNGDDKTVLATAPITVIATEVSLSGRNRSTWAAPSRSPGSGRAVATTLLRSSMPKATTATARSSIRSGCRTTIRRTDRQACRADQGEDL